MSSANNFDDVRSWLFKGLAAELMLDDLESDGSAVRATNDPRALQRVMPLDDFSPVVRAAAMRALPAYLAFFCFENAVRELVASRLQDNYGPTWWDSKASEAIRRKVAQRKDKEGKDRWHVLRGEHEIYYTDFGDLGLLIKNNWSDFEDLLPDQNWVEARLNELEASRNVIAHSNTLDTRELQRIQLYLSDWLRQVG